MKTIDVADVSDWTARNRWIWSFLGVVILWAILSAVTSHVSFSSLSGVAISSSFLTLVALGQTRGRHDRRRQHRSFDRERHDAQRLRRADRGWRP